jgi:hypothetical protein
LSVLIRELEHAVFSDFFDLARVAEEQICGFGRGELHGTFPGYDCANFPLMHLLNPNAATSPAPSSISLRFFNGDPFYEVAKRLRRENKRLQMKREGYLAEKALTMREMERRKLMFNSTVCRQKF